MNGFISRLIARHANPQNSIVPRLPGKFENAGSVIQNTYKTNNDATGMVNGDEHLSSTTIVNDKKNIHQTKVKSSDRVALTQQKIQEQITATHNDIGKAPAQDSF